MNRNFYTNPLQKIDANTEYQDRGYKTMCKIWIKGGTKDGYGQMKWDRKHQYVHRMAYEIAYGPIQKGMLVCHHCDQPPCCNPKHLFLGTIQDNVLDMKKKGRGRRGEDHGRAKLTEADIFMIHELRSLGFTQVRLAEQFNVSQRNISKILRGEKWKHLNIV